MAAPIAAPRSPPALPSSATSPMSTALGSTPTGPPLLAPRPPHHEVFRPTARSSPRATPPHLDRGAPTAPTSASTPAAAGHPTPSPSPTRATFSALRTFSTPARVRTRLSTSSTGGVYPRADQARRSPSSGAPASCSRPPPLLGHVAMPHDARALARWPPNTAATPSPPSSTPAASSASRSHREAPRGAPRPRFSPPSPATPACTSPTWIEDADGSLLVGRHRRLGPHGLPSSGPRAGRSSAGILSYPEDRHAALADPARARTAWPRSPPPRSARCLVTPAPPSATARSARPRSGRTCPRSSRHSPPRNPSLPQRPWALTRLATSAAQAAARRGLADRDPRVRQVAASSAFSTARCRCLRRARRRSSRFRFRRAPRGGRGRSAR